ncbi:MAG: purine permease [Clostridiales bacterium]|nr:purine permease [Clostridiales bacterium]
MEKSSIKNLYTLNGKVPVLRALPFGLQHILAMFVSNLAPITIIGAASGLEGAQISALLQNAMFVAGIATLIQLFPIWKIGAKLPIVMGVSFTFVTILSYVGASYGYPVAVGAMLIGGILEGCLGLCARYWRKIVTPVVAASVVTAIGFSLLPVGTRSFGGGYSESFGSAENLILGSVTLISCLAFNIFAKSYWKQLSVLFGLIVGYILACFMGNMDFASIFTGDMIAFPKFLPIMPEFEPGAIIAVTIIFMVSAAETIGDSTAVVASGLGREIEENEIRGALACDGFCSAMSALFGCPPVTSFSQNVGLVAMTGVVNRFTIGLGALCMILAGLLPPIGRFFSSLPESVLGGCTIMMFGTIMVSGIQMIAKAGFNQRNVTIVALSLAVGLGFTSATEADIWNIFPQIVQDIFSGNCVAVVFIVSILLSVFLPKNMEAGKVEEESGK